MEVQPTKKKCKVEECTTYKEEVLFNSDALSKVISYLPSVDLLKLAVTCKRFGIASGSRSSLIEESTRIAIHDIATEEQLAALPHYDGENSLADYHYLQLLREPLLFDQLVGDIEYVDMDKSCVKHNGGMHLATTFSNNILRGGKHYVTFVMFYTNYHSYIGVMRPGQANQNVYGYPCGPHFYRNFSPYNNYNDNNIHNNNVHCCLYGTNDGTSYSSNWLDGTPLSKSFETWDGREGMSSGDEIGMLLDLDEGSLSMYKNGRKLGVMKRGLAGPYCWVVSIAKGSRVTIKRGTIPPD